MNGESKLLVILAFLGTWASFFFGILALPQIKPPIDYYMAGGVTIAFVLGALGYALRGRDIIARLGNFRTLKILFGILLLTLTGLSWYGSISLFGSIRSSPDIASLPSYIAKFIGLAFAGGACLAAFILLFEPLREYFRNQYSAAGPS